MVTVDGVKIALGAAELRRFLLAKLLPKWDAYTRRFPFPDDAELVLDGKLLLIEPPAGGPERDVNALQKHLVKKGKTYSQVKLAFQISFEVANEMMSHREEVW